MRLSITSDLVLLYVLLSDQVLNFFVEVLVDLVARKVLILAQLGEVLTTLEVIVCTA